MMMRVFEHEKDTWRNFQRENLKALNISYDPIRHEANVFFLAVFCTHILLGFENKFKDLKDAFCQMALEQQRSEIQDYICENGTNADITYYKAFKLLIEKRDSLSMGNTICELLLKCNVKYDPLFDLPLGDMFVTYQAISRFEAFLTSFSDLADELRGEKIEIHSEANEKKDDDFAVYLVLGFCAFFLALLLFSYATYSKDYNSWLKVLALLVSFFGIGCLFWIYAKAKKRKR